MIDIHSHILNNVDDGSSSLEESIEMAREACQAGYTDIICTPHFLKGAYEIDKQTIKEVKENLEKNLRNEKMELHLRLGNEIYIEEDVIELLQDKKIASLDEKSYVLVELPMNSRLHNLEDILFCLSNLGYRVIIAHPERYAYVQENPNLLLDQIERGAYFQCNIASILGRYGKTARKTVKILLEHHMVQVMASDCHRKDSIYTQLKEIKKELGKIISQEEVTELLEENPKRILEDQELAVQTPKEYKKFKLF